MTIIMTIPRNSSPTRHRSSQCDVLRDPSRNRLASPKVNTTATMTIAIVTSAFGIDGISGLPRDGAKSLISGAALSAKPSGIGGSRSSKGPDALAYLAGRAKDKGASFDVLVNQRLEKDIALIKIET